TRTGTSHGIRRVALRTAPRLPARFRSGSNANAIPTTLAITSTPHTQAAAAHPAAREAAWLDADPDVPNATQSPSAAAQPAATPHERKQPGARRQEPRTQRGPWVRQPVTDLSKTSRQAFGGLEGAAGRGRELPGCLGRVGRRLLDPQQQRCGCQGEGGQRDDV